MSPGFPNELPLGNAPERHRTSFYQLETTTEWFGWARNFFDDIRCFSYISAPWEGAELEGVTAATGPGDLFPMPVRVMRESTTASLHG